jgi:hypothetical protein
MNVTFLRKGDVDATIRTRFCGRRNDASINERPYRALRQLLENECADRHTSFRGILSECVFIFLPPSSRRNSLSSLLPP